MSTVPNFAYNNKLFLQFYPYTFFFINQASSIIMAFLLIGVALGTAGRVKKSFLANGDCPADCNFEYDSLARRLWCNFDEICDFLDCDSSASGFVAACLLSWSVGFFVGANVVG